MSLSKREERDMQLLASISLDELEALMTNHPEMHDYIIYLLKKMRDRVVDFVFDMADVEMGDNYEEANKVLAKFRLPASE
jgi:nucleoid-associated protein YejK